MIRVLIADHPLVRRGVAHLLESKPEFAVPGEAENQEQLFRLLDAEKWDVLVLDLAMPGRGGLEVIEELHRRKLKIPILVISMLSETHLAARAIRAAAKGFLTKDTVATDLIHSIRLLAAGKRYFPPVVLEALASTVAEQPRHSHEVLSNRELLIMCKIAGGMTVAEVADEMSLSIKTVHTHRARALQKMGMRSNVEFTRYAVQSRLID